MVTETALSAVVVNSAVTGVPQSSDLGQATSSLCAAVGPACGAAAPATAPGGPRTPGSAPRPAAARRDWSTRPRSGEAADSFGSADHGQGTAAPQRGGACRKQYTSCGHRQGATPGWLGFARGCAPGMWTLAGVRPPAAQRRLEQPPPQPCKQ